MSIDISQFHDVFFEESFEGLDAMESGLLNLDVGAADIEAINTIFRAAHSIKGGAGTFGFMDVSEFTHVMETLLDEIRNGERDVTTESTNLFLEAVDVLREMLTAVKDKVDTDKPRIAEVATKLEAMMTDGNGSAPASDGAASSSSAEPEKEEAKPQGWLIDFRPHQHLLQTGNDPVRMFREMESLGELSVVADDEKLPSFADLEPEDSYLSFQLTLKGEIPKEDVIEIFEWVDDDCDLKIEPIIIEGAEVPVEAKQEEAPEVVVEQVAPAPVAEVVKPKVAAADKPKAAPAAAASIRVGTDKIDSLINLVGELVITQSMLSQIGDNFTEDLLPKLVDGLDQLERNSREMQEAIMRIRMLPISFAFNRFPRLVHDMTSKMGKKVELKLTGEQTELDKTVMEKIGDPLVHLVRNSLDHGLETPDVRLASGKDEMGTLNLNAYHQGGNIVIEIKDDGAGLNEDKILGKAIEKGLVNAGDNLTPDKIHELIFLPGFSTADVVTDVSGRGVGMDVVRKNIN
ncbi:MAG: chemotaxis protein CheA, partial [Proteobacteria bacterium]|nr:chemotaxis protein CheA [Pseudomonadota bacterium]